MTQLAGDLEHILEYTRPLWDDLRGERVFITGGTGFFGCWLLESFAWANDHLKLGAQAVVLTRDLGRFRERAPGLAAHGSIVLMPGDVRTFNFPAGDFSHIIHAATDSAVVPSQEQVADTILRGTEQCLEFAQRAHCRRFLFTSSGAVYGKQPPELRRIDESYGGAPDPEDPNQAYGRAKRRAEELCDAAQSASLEMKLARCFAFVGAYMNLDVHFAIGNFIRDQMRGGPIVVKGDGTAVRSYLYASDLAIWLWTMLFQAPSGRVYNVGSEEDLSIAELARAVATTEEPPVEVRIAGRPTGAPAARYVPSTQRAQTELGLRQRVSLASAICKTRAWCQGAAQP